MFCVLAVIWPILLVITIWLHFTNKGQGHSNMEKRFDYLPKEEREKLVYGKEFVNYAIWKDYVTGILALNRCRMCRWDFK